MWRKLPLNFKIISAVIVVQIVALSFGAIWMTRWISSTRLSELRALLDVQGDAIEEGINQETNGELSFSHASEMIRELNGDREFYYLLMRSDGSIIDEGAGPSQDVRNDLRNAINRASRTHGVYTVKSANVEWYVQSERVSDVAGGGQIHVAINTQPVTDEIAQFEQLVFIGALCTLLITSIGTGMVVSFTTRNLRDFSNRMKNLVPPRFSGDITLVPQSLEEQNLFQSYSDLIAIVRVNSDAQRLFLAHASHELKTPIAASLSALEVAISRPRSAGEYEQTCRDVLAEMKVLKRLSTGLLELTQLESKPTPVTNFCDIFPVLNRTVERWFKGADERSIQIRLDFDHEVRSCQVQGSPEQWEVIIGNLIDNAIKFGKKGGVVSMSLRKLDPYELKLVIQDDGLGMSSEDVGKLGEIFFRADQSRNSSLSFGLGFAHAKRLIGLINGSIKVDSNLGVGTSITLCVPLPKSVSRDAVGV